MYYSLNKLPFDETGEVSLSARMSGRLRLPDRLPFPVRFRLIPPPPPPPEVLWLSKVEQVSSVSGDELLLDFKIHQM